MDATCKVQDNIHVFRLVHNMCPGFWVHITTGKEDIFYAKTHIPTNLIPNHPTQALKYID